jgi:hypothetical protein
MRTADMTSSDTELSCESGTASQNDSYATANEEENDRK